ncbi:proteasome subunit beta type-1 [Parasteatoda tepidariorum]|uniref:proteasome subunit beta type-1 n=1 Tax=Parasteatoda tepidariorum TaxID=114398 RepID=UPI00077FC338|nr:proteasome subunit beta type-1 [Parasteatoda tepidariorum]
MDLFATQNIEGYGKPKQLSFNPYENNEGSIVAIRGDDFVVIGADTRLSTGYSILSRDCPKLFKLSNKTIMGLTGCWCDALTLSRLVEARMKMYMHEHNKQISTPALAQLLSSLLYYKRFFPYYVHSVVAGLDNEGKGRVYSYDSVGHKSETSNIAFGSAAHLLQPLLDNQIDGKNIGDVVPKKEPKINIDDSVTIIKDVFTSAAERNIYCGDSVLMYILSADGLKEMSFSLRKD